MEFKLHDKGTEVIVAKCTEDKDAKVGVEHEYSKNAFTTLGNYRDFVARQITVVAATDKTDDKTEKKKVFGGQHGDHVRGDEVDRFVISCHPRARSFVSVLDGGGRDRDWESVVGWRCALREFSVCVFAISA